VAVRFGSPERRQLTIMVCHMVDRAPLSTHLEPEDLHDLIAPFTKWPPMWWRRFDGFVAQYLGRWRGRLLRLSRSS